MTAFGYPPILLAIAIILAPGLLTSPDSLVPLAYFGTDYEDQHCGVASGKRNLKSRAFLYFMQPHNLSSGVCMNACPHLRDEIVCDYTYAAAEMTTKRAQLGKRCFMQLRTRAAFTTCLPLDPSAASTVDAWLSAHTWMQVGSDTLAASGVIFGCWLAAAAAGALVLLGLQWLPRTTLFTTLMTSLVLAPAYGAVLLPHGWDELSRAQQPAELGYAISAREPAAAQAVLGAGWLAVLCSIVMLLTLLLHARHAPLAVAVLEASAQAVSALPASVALLPLYVSVVAIGVLGVWLGSAAYYVSLGNTGALGALWALSVLPLVWLLALLVVLEWSLVGAAVGASYVQRRRAAAAGSPHRLRATVWRSCCVVLRPEHVEALATAAALLPISGAAALLLAGSGAHPRRDSSPLARLVLTGSQRSLRALRAMRELVHPGAILQLPALRPKLERGTDPGAPPALEETGAEAAQDDDGDGFLAAGRRCARLFATTPARLHAARAHVHYFLEHAKISIAAGSGLVGWFWLTDPPAAPLLMPLMPLLLIVIGSYALASTAITLSQASVEAVLQCYCEETRLLVRNTASGGKPEPEADKPKA